MSKLDLRTQTTLDMLFLIRSANEMMDRNIDKNSTNIHQYVSGAESIIRMLAKPEFKTSEIKGLLARLINKESVTHYIADDNAREYFAGYIKGIYGTEIKWNLTNGRYVERYYEKMYAEFGNNIFLKKPTKEILDFASRLV